MNRQLSHLIAILTVMICAYCHPQCLDFRAPFQPASPLGFCSEYADYACCEFCNRVSLSDANYCYPDLKTNPVLSGETAAQTSAAPGCLCLQKINPRLKLAMPLWAGSPNDGSGRLFVMEQIGRIRIYNTRTQRWNFGCFLDLTLKARVLPVPTDERGAMSIAFHPNFANNGRFFVFYTAARGLFEPLPEELEGRPFFFEDKVIISEWRVSKLNPDVADIFSERKLITLYQPYLNHNGGLIMFGEDGYLYAFFGDGGGAGDPMKSSQDKTLLHGKVIRIDVDSDRSKPYTIPDDNPFVNETDTRPEIYALGMRNPWRCGMDRGARGTGNNRGRILCGDVGQYGQEEIDLLKPGVNYGWSAREGFQCYDQATCGNIGNSMSC
ncbi:HHIP-like protein 1 [Elysia marginata]|uniref:HHIP-like protein 1 n=1 Tax=Elysia marginata TaxID=1093978 RepID=A0AAV4F9Y5_9GAST|nr:HHIP-like protein 1 [Elysia marginata]